MGQSFYSKLSMGPGARHLLFFPPPHSVVFRLTLSLWHLIGRGPGFTNCRLARSDSCAFFPGDREVRSGCLPYHTHARGIHRVDILFRCIVILLSIHFSSMSLCSFLCPSFSIHGNWHPILASPPQQGAIAVVGACALSQIIPCW